MRQKQKQPEILGLPTPSLLPERKDGDPIYSGAKVLPDGSVIAWERRVGKMIYQAAMAEPVDPPDPAYRDISGEAEAACAALSARPLTPEAAAQAQQTIRALTAQIATLRANARFYFSQAFEVFQSMKQEEGRLKASIRLHKDTDGKQAAKGAARILWDDWQAGRTRHKSGAAFVRAVLDKHPQIQHPRTVERWVRAWAAERAAARLKGDD